ncbi:MAG: ribosome maturation factor RimM [Clostridiales bacterium]|nr:ribosome maturation factor RimM [Clostridiales bacterium]
MEFLEAGKIINTHGLRGEVKLVTWTDFPEDFEALEHLYVNRKTGQETLTIENIKYQKNNIIVKFKEISDINEAQKYKNLIVLADRSELGELPEGVHYIVDLIGLDIVDENGEKIGVLQDVLNTGANDIYEIKREGAKNMLLPVIDDVVLDIDIENGKITVKIPEGLDEI